MFPQDTLDLIGVCCSSQTELDILSVVPLPVFHQMRTSRNCGSFLQAHLLDYELIYV